MKILAIDPGPKKSAVLELVDGKIAGGRIEHNAEIQCACNNAYFNHAIVAIEYPQMCSVKGIIGKVVADLLDTREEVGRFDPDRKALLIPARTIRKHICGSAKAKDKDVRAACIKRFGPDEATAIGTKKKPGPLYNITSHLWSALAVALYVQETGGKK